jgi:hypothetical protein
MDMISLVDLLWFVHEDVLIYPCWDIDGGRKGYV